ncbi:HNH endonuclease signature motif containing protein [Raineyella antarctica]|nr:HNH endonuclease signature motif containing protein [Raineyella antarctica]
MDDVGDVGVGGVPPDPVVPGVPESGVPESGVPESVVAAVAGVEAFLEAGPVVLPGRALLAAGRALQGLSSMVRAAELAVVAEIEARGACLELAGVSTAAWLRESNRLTARQAAGQVRSASGLAAHPYVAAVLASGAGSPEQCRAIVEGLAALEAGDVDPITVGRVEEVLVGYVDRHDPDELRRLAQRVLEVVAPEVAEEALRRGLEREEELARRRRRMEWARDGQGSVFFRVKLPTVEAEELIGQVEAWVARGRRLDESDADGADPGFVPPTLDQRRADALMQIVHASMSRSASPVHGGDRPRMTVVIDWEDLASRVGVGQSLDSGQGVSPAQVRQMACDCDVLPVVLGGESQPLDVGRTRRLVAGDLRQVVHLRDRGCAFPGCDRRPRDCEVHHIVPWACGGVTALENLVLLCRHHHGLVEPDPRSVPGSRWEVRMAGDGLAEFLPPERVGSGRAPRRHSRYMLQTPEGQDVAA